MIHDSSDIIIFRAEIKASRADRLPPFDEYNPNRIHVARRRRAWKDHTSFPRGWVLGPDEKNLTIKVGDGCTEDSNASLYIDGVKIS